jgi:hypothetical protein
MQLRQTKGRGGDVWFGDLDEYKWIFTSDLMLA